MPDTPLEGIGSSDQGCGEWCFLRNCFSVPAWGISEDGTICFVNQKAEELLGVTAEQAVGKPCHEVVRGRDRNFEPVCSEDCSVRTDARSREEREPKLLQIGGLNGCTKWIQVVPVVNASSGKRRCVVETAVDVNRWARIEAYVQGVADCESRPGPDVDAELTAREREVLSLLAEGLTQHDVAKRLHVSYTTVRTHVQRILPKVGVCSIQGAVAYHLLDQ